MSPAPTPLPLADEVRAARARADAASLAVAHLQRLAAAERALELLAGVPGGLRLPAELAAEQESLLAEIHEAWGADAGEPGVGESPVPGATFRHLRTLLAAHAEGAAEKAGALRAALHAQASHLQDPDLAPTVKLVKELGARRQACLEQLRPARQRAARFGPTLDALRGFADRLEQTARDRELPDPRGALALRAGRLAASLGAQLDAALSELGLEGGVAAGAAPDGAWATLDAVHQRLLALIARLEGERAEVDRLAAALAEEAESTGARILDLTG